MTDRRSNVEGSEPVEDKRPQDDSAQPDDLREATTEDIAGVAPDKDDQPE